VLSLGLAAVLSISIPLFAANKFLVDGMHGDTYLGQMQSHLNLDSLYPEMQFRWLTADQLPVYHVLTAGTVLEEQDSIVVDVAEGTPALYVLLNGSLVQHHMSGFGQYPYIAVRGPDQVVTQGAYGYAHVDDPIAGQYVVHVSWSENHRYLIGTGPHIWDVYPPKDYDAMLSLQSPAMRFFVGTPPFFSENDTSRLHDFMNDGGGVGLFYDGAEPMAWKPIIRLHNYPRGGATIQLNLPGMVTYVKPEPESRAPLTWKVAEVSEGDEFDYEARFDNPLNFVWYDPASKLVMNHSWATVRDLKLIEFVKGQGYRIAEIGTLPPGSESAVPASAAEDFSRAVERLDRTLRVEATSSGLTADEIQTFFDHYQWAARVAARSCLEPGVVALYRIEGLDYEALFPLTTTPAPASRTRVLWVDSYLPRRVTAPCTVHSQLSAPARTIGEQGQYHEYGVFRETYGGDALDDLDAWGWHFDDQMLIDSTSISEPQCYGCYFFPRWSNSVLANILSQGIQRAAGRVTGGITSESTADELLTGGENCHTDGGPFPIGSYPAVIVGRETAQSGKIIGTGDLAFLDNIGDNLRLGRNIFNWLHRAQTENVPDIEIRNAVVFHAVAQGNTAASTVALLNTGSADLIFSTSLPTASWLVMTGPTEGTIAAGDSAVFSLAWSGVGLLAGFYQAWWDIVSNDSNEDTLHWPILLQVESGSGISPEPNLSSPNRFALDPPFPNPFNASTRISFTLPKAGNVDLNVYDVTGRLVRSLIGQTQGSPLQAGEHSFVFDGSDLPSGIYFVRLDAGEVSQTRKMVLLK
jgi:hypothetical protein